MLFTQHHDHGIEPILSCFRDIKQRRNDFESAVLESGLRGGDEFLCLERGWRYKKRIGVVMILLDVFVR